MILSVCMSPCTDVTIELDSLKIGRTNVVKNKSFSLGGKGLNVAVGVARLGFESHVTGLMYDENGYLFENALQEEDVPYSFVWNAGRARENYKFIDGRSMLTEVNDVGEEISEEKAIEALNLVKTLSLSSDVAVLSGSLPRGIDASYYGELARAVAPNVLKVVDASGQRMFSAMQEGVDLVKPNLEELEHTLGRKISDKAEMIAACYELLDRGAKRVLLSLGKQGAVITDGGDVYYCKSINVAMNSTVGAGDAMVAASAVQLQQGAGLEEILRAGVAAGTATVMTVGQISFEKEKYDEVFASLQVKKL